MDVIGVILKKRKNSCTFACTRAENGGIKFIALFVNYFNRLKVYMYFFYTDNLSI